MRKLAETVAEQRKNMKVTKKKTWDTGAKVETDVDKLAVKDKSELMREQRDEEQRRGRADGRRDGHVRREDVCATRRETVREQRDESAEESAQPEEPPSEALRGRRRRPRVQSRVNRGLSEHCRVTVSRRLYRGATRMQRR